MPLDIRLAKYGEGVLGAWKVIGVFIVDCMSVGKFLKSRISPKCLISGQPRISIVDAV